VNAVSFAVMLGTMLVNVAVSTWERRAGKRLASPFLVADATHTQSDVYASLSVILSLVAVRLGLPIVDVLAAFFIILLIGRSAFQIVTASFGVLSDAATGNPEEIARVAGSVAGVLGCHRVRARGLPDDLHVDLHVLVDRTLTLEHAHRIADQVEAAILEQVPGVSDIVVHTEPDNHDLEHDAFL
jgi:cation diffusion facilitator family transporter